MGAFGIDTSPVTTQEKNQGATVAAMTTGSSPAPTIFSQVVVIHAGLCREVGITANEFLPAPKNELPSWCGNIIKQFGKTIFKPVSKLRPKGKVDWRNYGRAIGILERYKTFWSHDVPRIIEQEFGDLSDEQWNRIESRLGLDEVRVCLIKTLNRTVTDEEPLEKLYAEASERHLENLESHKRVALYHVAQQGAKEAGLFYKGMGGGYGLFLDEHANFSGASNRTNIYCTLLASMMEVEKLRRTLPPKTRAQYYNELAEVFRLPPKAYGWFNDVCDDIKFPLNNLGRKRHLPALIL